MRTTVFRLSPLLAAALACGSASGISHADDLRLPAVKDAVVAKECSACHMLYPAGLLPARSWMALVGNLSDHFGENAELDEESRQAIAKYLADNAADAGGRGNKMTRGLSSDDTPLRITELPYFLRKHEKRGRISSESLKRHGARWPGDCKACHRGAEQGLFDDDD